MIYPIVKNIMVCFDSLLQLSNCEVLPVESELKGGAEAEGKRNCAPSFINNRKSDIVISPADLAEHKHGRQLEQQLRHIDHGGTS